MRFWILLLALLATCASPAQEIRVATRVISPFVIQSPGRLTGFSIDLWKELSSRLGVKSTYVVEPNVKELLDAVKTGRADVGISAVSITAEREKDLDFSQPMFNGGLQILVLDKEGSQSGARQLWNQIVSSGIFPLLLIFFLLGLIPAHVVWFSEHRHENCVLRHRTYFPGIFEAYWWSLACLATQAEEMPRSWTGRVVAILWMFTAVVFVAFFTAQVTASLTVQQLQGSIKGPEDLPGKTVATTTGSTSAEYLKENKINALEFARIDDAYDALKDGKADAVVFDSPVLQYYASHDGKGRFDVVGEVFRKESYGIVFPSNSPLRKRVDLALLSMQEDGTYDELMDKWFRAK